jgi:hypothetical protein
VWGHGCCLLRDARHEPVGESRAESGEQISIGEMGEQTTVLDERTKDFICLVVLRVVAKGAVREDYRYANREVVLHGEAAHNQRKVG